MAKTKCSTFRIVFFIFFIGQCINSIDQSLFIPFIKNAENSDESFINDDSGETNEEISASTFVQSPSKLNTLDRGGRGGKFHNFHSQRTETRFHSTHQGKSSFQSESQFPVVQQGQWKQQVSNRKPASVVSFFADDEDEPKNIHTIAASLNNEKTNTGTFQDGLSNQVNFPTQKTHPFQVADSHQSRKEQKNIDLVQNVGQDNFSFRLNRLREVDLPFLGVPDDSGDSITGIQHFFRKETLPRFRDQGKKTISSKDRNLLFTEKSSFLENAEDSSSSEESDESVEATDGDGYTGPVDAAENKKTSKTYYFGKYKDTSGENVKNLPIIYGASSNKVALLHQWGINTENLTQNQLQEKLPNISVLSSGTSKHFSRLIHKIWPGMKGESPKKRKGTFENNYSIKIQGNLPDLTINTHSEGNGNEKSRGVILRNIMLGSGNSAASSGSTISQSSLTENGHVISVHNINTTSRNNLKNRRKSQAFNFRVESDSSDSIKESELRSVTMNANSQINKGIKEIFGFEPSSQSRALEGEKNNVFIHNINLGSRNSAIENKNSTFESGSVKRVGLRVYSGSVGRGFGKMNHGKAEIKGSLRKANLGNRLITLPRKEIFTFESVPKSSVIKEKNNVFVQNINLGSRRGKKRIFESGSLKENRFVSDNSSSMDKRLGKLMKSVGPSSPKLTRYFTSRSKEKKRLSSGSSSGISSRENRTNSFVHSIHLGSKASSTERKSSVSVLESKEKVVISSGGKSNLERFSTKTKGMNQRSKKVGGAGLISENPRVTAHNVNLGSTSSMAKGKERSSNRQVIFKDERKLFAAETSGTGQVTSVVKEEFLGPTFQHQSIFNWNALNIGNILQGLIHSKKRIVRPISGNKDHYQYIFSGQNRTDPSNQMRGGYSNVPTNSDLNNDKNKLVAGHDVKEQAQLVVHTKHTVICRHLVDVIFVLDGSDSIDMPSMEQMKMFVINFMSGFQIHQMAAMFGAVMYSSNVSGVVNLGSVADRPSMNAAIRDLPHEMSGTNTATGIQSMRQMFAMHSRPEVPKVSIVITDGRSKNYSLTTTQARLAHQEGITIFAVGVGQFINKDELRDIATYGKVRTVANFRELQKLTYKLSREVCTLITPTTTTSTTIAAPTTITPTAAPTTITPTAAPTTITPTAAPTTITPTAAPTTITPTAAPTTITPTAAPTTITPTAAPTTITPTDAPTTITPTAAPTTITPTAASTTITPTAAPTTITPTAAPTTITPTAASTTITTTAAPTTITPTAAPTTITTTAAPTTTTPTAAPTTITPTAAPTTITPTAAPTTTTPTAAPTTITPTAAPTTITTTAAPTTITTHAPTMNIITLLDQTTYYSLPSNVCDECRLVNGVGYREHSRDCQLYIQCYVLGSVIKSVIRDCRIGQFWDQHALTCKPAQLVNCITDRCRISKIRGYQNKNNCRAYWTCIGGKSYGRCCQPGHIYIEGNGCVQDNTCRQSCELNQLSPEICPLKTVPGDDTVFQQNIAGHGWKVQKCAPGTLFNISACSCNTFLRRHSSLAQTCKPEIHLTFDGNDGVMFGIKNENVTVQNGVAKFNGNSRLLLWRFANAYLGKKVFVRVRFIERGNSGYTEAIVSNGDCDHEPSLYIAAERETKQLHMGAVTDIGTSIVSIAYNTNGWNEVTYMFAGDHVTGSVNGVRETGSTITGSIKSRQCAMQIGAGYGMRNFHGEIDEISLYLCKPENIFEPTQISKR